MSADTTHRASDADPAMGITDRPIYLAGDWVRTDERVLVTGPAGSTADPAATYHAGPEELERAIVAAVVAEQEMAELPAYVRGDALRSISQGILDRRDLYVSLDRLGMPRTTMDAARRRAVMSPLRQVTIGSALCAVAVILPLAGISLIVAPLSLATIAACIVAGVALVWLGLRATRPVLERAVTEPGTAALGR